MILLEKTTTHQFLIKMFWKNGNLVALVVVGQVSWHYELSGSSLDEVVTPGATQCRLFYHVQ